MNAIAPGYTPGWSLPSRQRCSMALLPGRRSAGSPPPEIARGVAFLVADDAGFITGATLSTHGGKNLA